MLQSINDGIIRNLKLARRHKRLDKNHIPTQRIAPSNIYNPASIAYLSSAAKFRVRPQWLSFYCAHAFRLTQFDSLSSIPDCCTMQNALLCKRSPIQTLTVLCHFLITMKTVNQTSHRPDFLCIGAKKAGTTWLHANLRQHPTVWMPPIKELRHFDSNSKIPWLLYTIKKTENGNIARYALTRWRLARVWLLRYLCAYRSDAWYSSLFLPSAKQICGEIAPTYAPLAPAKIARVKRWLPHAKIIYLLRDPVERLWSNQKMWVDKYRHEQIDNLPQQQVIQDLDRRWSLLTPDGDYLGNLERWQTHYAPDHLAIRYFEELEANPVAFFKSILTYLELATNDDVIPPDIAVPRNKRGGRTMPPAIRCHITERLYPQIEALHDHFDNAYTATWLQNADVTLNTTVAP